jgi:hypothetical protein
VYGGYPKPWRGWLLALTALIVALIIAQFVIGGSTALFVVVLVLIAIQLGLIQYARKRM